MLTIAANTSNSKTISIPQDELEKLGINVGDEIEFYKNENDEIVLRNAAEAKRKQKFEEAREKVFKEWNNVFVALAKGVDENSENIASSNNRKFVLQQTTNDNYKFVLTTTNNQIVFESKIFKSKEEARKAIDAIRSEISEIKDEILNLPVQTELIGG